MATKKKSTKKKATKKKATKRNSSTDSFGAFVQETWKKATKKKATKKKATKKKATKKKATKKKATKKKATKKKATKKKATKKKATKKKATKKKATRKKSSADSITSGATERYINRMVKDRTARVGKETAKAEYKLKLDEYQSLLIDLADVFDKKTPGPAIGRTITAQQAAFEAEATREAREARARLKALIKKWKKKKRLVKIEAIARNIERDVPEYMNRGDLVYAVEAARAAKKAREAANERGATRVMKEYNRGRVEVDREIGRK